VRGTASVLDSALKHGSTLKRVILTSSVAADQEDTAAPRVFAEGNRNHSAAKAAKTKGSAAGPVTIHLASKTLAEKVAWKFVAAYGSQISWDLVVLNPLSMFGVSLFFGRLISQS
jgi:nucleoside-diphosphate-sugar epimerase